MKTHGFRDEQPHANFCYVTGTSVIEAVSDTPTPRLTFTRSRSRSERMRNRFANTHRTRKHTRLLLLLTFISFTMYAWLSCYRASSANTLVRYITTQLLLWRAAAWGNAHNWQNAVNLIFIPFFFSSFIIRLKYLECQVRIDCVLSSWIISYESWYMFRQVYPAHNTIVRLHWDHQEIRCFLATACLSWRAAKPVN